MYLLKIIDIDYAEVIEFEYSNDGEKNMYRVLAVSLVAILLMVVGMGCVPQNAAQQPAAIAPAVNINTINAEVTAIKAWQTDMSTWRAGTVDPMIGKINRGEIGGSSGATKSDIETLRSTISAQDTKITDLTTRLTTAENTLKTYTAPVASGGVATTGTTGQTTQFTPGTITGTIPTSPTGGIVSQVNWVQGQSQFYSSPSGSSNMIWYVQRLMNQSTTIQYVRPLINLGVSSSYSGYSTSGYFAGMNVNISSPQGSVQAVYNPAAWGWSPAISCDATNPSNGSWPMNSCTSNVIYSTIGATQSATYPYAPSGTMYMTLAPGLGQVTNSMMIMPTAGLSNGLGEFYISPGGYIDITVMIQDIYTNTATMWNISASFSSHT